MSAKNLILYVVLGAALCSCSSLSHSGRTGKDLYLSPQDFSALNGCLAEAAKAVPLYKYLTGKELPYFDTITHLCLVPLDKKSIALRLMRHGVAVDSTRLSGRYSAGYFEISKHTAKFPAGPFFWSLNKQTIALGISRANQLVYRSGSGGYLFVLFLPIMSAQTGVQAGEFKWTK